MEEKNQKVDWRKKDFAPLSFWAWNDLMDEESIKNQIREFHQQGFGGFFMHSRGGLLTPYFSDEWFEACRVAAREAAVYDMEAWIYDEDGWPSGFAGGRVNGLGEKYQAKCFELVEARPEDEKYVIGTYRTSGDGYVRCGIEEADIFAVYHAEPNYADLLSGEVTGKFIEITYERYKKELGEFFGKTVPGYFTDEPQFLFDGFPYSEELSGFFKNRNGYFMEDKLFLLLPRFSDQAHEFRSDFWNTIQEMMCENFSKQIYDWCEKNGVSFTGHYPGEDSLIHQIQSTGGVMPKYQYMQMPGIDHLGRRITSLVLTKQVTSVAKQLERKKILSETFGCGGWNIPFEDLCYLWGWQAAAGINVPVLHIGAHTIGGIRKRDYPAFYSYQEPWWDRFSHMANWLSGIGLKMAQGRWTEKVLVVSPMEGIRRVHGGAGQNTDQEREIAAGFRQLCDCLTDIQVGFDLGDETLMGQHGAVEGNRLRVGVCTYQYVIVSKTVALKEKTWELLGQFHEQGGMVIFAQDRPVSQGKRAWISKCQVVCNVRRFWNKYFQNAGFEREVTIYDQSGFYLASGLNVSVKSEQDVLRAFIWNFQTDSVRELLIEVQGTRQIYQVDPETLERTELKEGYFCGKGKTLLPFKLHQKQCVLLEFEQTDIARLCREERGESLQRIRGKVERAHDNGLTLDYAAYSLDGKNYSQYLPIVKLHPLLYASLKEKPSDRIYVRYLFKCKTEENKNIRIAIEDRDSEEILLNGQSIIENKNGWYMDRIISCYGNGGWIRQGENLIDITYKLKQNQVLDTEGLFETQVNRFFYPVEPEAIYLLGDFDVETDATVIQNMTHISVGEKNGRPDFVLAPPKELIFQKDYTSQGLWFYRGDLRITFQVELKGEEALFLKVENPEAAFVEAACNGHSIISYMQPYEIELTPLLERGNNQVQLLLRGTNRNLLGPHHHIKGENLFVGCNTFKGVKGYEDSMFNFELSGDSTWTDSYAFVPFGCGKIWLITKS